MIYAINKRTKEHRRGLCAADLRTGEWTTAEADADGWIEWRGGECPLPDDCKTEYKMKEESGSATSRNGAQFLRWESVGDRADIIAYRPILDDRERPSAMRRGKTEVETLRLNGWGIGDILEGDEGYGPDRIEITHIGEKRFGCRWDYKCNGDYGEEKFNTTLACREWRKVGEGKEHDMSEQEWNGEGLPPVDTECEVECGLNDYKPCKILAHYKGKAVFVLHFSGAIHSSKYGFRPIRTAAQRAEDEAVDEMMSAVDEHITPEEICRALYRAGYRDRA